MATLAEIAQELLDNYAKNLKDLYDEGKIISAGNLDPSDLLLVQSQSDPTQVKVILASAFASNETGEVAKRAYLASAVEATLLNSLVKMAESVNGPSDILSSTWGVTALKIGNAGNYATHPARATVTQQNSISRFCSNLEMADQFDNMKLTANNRGALLEMDISGNIRFKYTLANGNAGDQVVLNTAMTLSPATETMTLQAHLDINANYRIKPQVTASTWDNLTDVNSNTVKVERFPDESAHIQGEINPDSGFALYLRAKRC